MKDLKDQLQDAVIIMRMDNKATIKGMVEKLTEQGFDSQLWNTKSKALFIESLQNRIDELNETMLTTELDSLKLEISATIEEAGKASFRLGSLLLKAREACENQQEFLEWVDFNFGIKKAWAFKLMKVSQVFEGEPWCNVATSVLYILQSQANDEQMLEAKKFAEAGKLDIQTVKSLLNPPVAAVKVNPVNTEQVDQKISESVQTALMDTEPKEVAPAVEPVAAPVAVLSPVVDKSKDELLAQMSEMAATIKELTEKLADATKPRLRSSSDMPMLRQFNSPLMHVRLGISQQEAQSKDIILEAFKDLCKAGYGRAHEAFNLIDEARHILIHQIKEVEVAA
ncbi:hypothetical protein [Klebsiella phage KL01]|uniref:Uncharacterized protein n=2 Tax=root TaxID=1 RepID=A0AA96Q2E6_9CAUD|nr:hypothetical protein [Sphingobacterium alkalisoli]WNV46812.1 hypothetical protein [Klebsiella phage KL01]GGH32487.1 hypothetical protein GCM10011418_46040 [Sphingobacterium alkalisoli]